MTKRILAVSAFLLTAVTLLAAEANNAVTLSITATAEHPRNSEGAFVTLKSGRILFCYSQFSEGDSDFSPCQIAQVMSDDQGRTWSAPRILFTAEPGSLEMSVSMVRLSSGKIALFSAIKHGKRDCRPYLRMSSDEGETWTAARALIDEPGYFVLNNDRVIQTSTGRLIVPLALHRPVKHEENSEHAVDLRAIDLWYYSDDEGATWHEAKTWWALPVVSETGLQEPGVVELKDRSLFSWARTDQGSQYGFRSQDNGMTWSAPQPTTLRSPASPASIKRLPNSGDLLAVYNDYSGQFPFVLTPQTYSGRTPLVAAVSTDGGATWQNRKLLEADPQRDYCYAAIHFTGESVLLAYMSNTLSKVKPSELTIRRVNLSWLVAPDDAVTARAKTVLHRVFDEEESWVKIHAAEALLAGGEAVSMRERFLRMVPTVNSLVYRVGVWRVLANTSPTIREREACVAEVEKIFLDASAPDRPQALETLCKLRVRVTGPTLDLVRRTVSEGPENLLALARWSLRLAEEPGAADALSALLKSENPAARLGASYALRQLRENDPSALAALARAAKAEPADSRAYPYMISAAFALAADATSRPAWRSTLEKIVATGPSGARFEACQALLPVVSLADLPKYEPLLDDSDNDTKIGAGLTLFYVHARQ